MMKREEGYTILEAMCAFAILAAILVLLYSTGGTTSRLLADTSEDSRVVLLVRSKLDELGAMRAPLPRVQTGRFAGTEVHWRLESKNAIPESERTAKYQLQDVTLTVGWPGTVEPRHFSIQTRHFGIEP